MELDPRQLFSADSITAYEQGVAAQLVTRRNGQLGNLLNAERGVFYVQILYGLLRFRRAHELEPLHDDLFAAVQPAQAAFAEDGYDAERFREDVGALLEWKLIAQRIELERLRGYRDARRKKFRYSLTDEAVAFLEWLEERLRDDLDERGVDTRNLLEAVCSALRELNRVLYHVQTANAQNGDARRVLFQLGNLDGLTHAVSDDLVSLNARMYGFVLHPYTVAEAREILRELDTFVQAFLRQIYVLRGEIMELLEKVHGERAQEKITACIAEMEAERRQAPHLLRRLADPSTLARVPVTLREFYREGGTLDILCRRINATTISVWRKLHLHLRELERKNHRLEDLRARIAEIAALPAEAVPGAFLFELIAPAQHYTDPQYWDEHENASPPEPRCGNGRQEERPPTPLPKKARTDGPVRTLEQKRLALLQEWLDAKVITPAQASALLAHGQFDTFDDLVRVMELVKTGHLGRGRKLTAIGYRLERSAGVDTLVAAEYTLTLPAVRVARGGHDGRE